MKNSHLTLRLPRELARALAHWARERGLPKSELAREAVARYLAPPPATTRLLTAAELAARWPLLPRLSPPEATRLGDTIDASRRRLRPVRPAWE